MKLRAFIDALHSARSFEQAAERLLDRTIDCATQGLETVAVVLRAMVHLRPGDAYLGVALREVDEAASSGVQVMPSMTAWRWVEIAGGPVLLDVQRGQAAAADGTPLQVTGARRPDFRSRDAVLTRHATHILGCPLRRAGQRVDGFLSVEIAADGDLAGWPQVASELQMLVDVAAPFVGELPREAREASGGEPGLPVIGARMRPFIEDLRLFADTDWTILLRGETGVGKSRLAKWCWMQSPRKDQPFVPVSLAAQPENLREGALFGWRKGSFSGATEDREGLVAKAAGGTLFIDEIDKLPLPGQAMLLSLLDEGEYRVIGDTELHSADVRFIVGTNADLEAAIEQGTFLEDLYHRIQDLPVRVLPLRDRRDEIVPWAGYLLGELQEKSGRPGGARMEATAGSLLEGHAWPGNVRQLHAVIKRAYKFAESEAGTGELVVGAAHVERALAYGSRASSDPLWRALERAADEFVTQALVPGRALTLEHAGAFAGFVLRDAVARIGEKRAFEIFGREKSLASSNHRKVIRRERERVAALAEALGRQPDTD